MKHSYCLVRFTRSHSKLRLSLHACRITACILSLSFAVAGTSLSSAHAQTPSQSLAPAADQAKTAADASATPQAAEDSSDTRDKGDGTLPAINPQHATRTQNIASAWSMLRAAATDPKHMDRRVQAMSIIGNLGASPQAEALLRKGFADPELEVRIAAILAAGGTASASGASNGLPDDLTGDRNLFGDIRTLLNDKEPQVAYTAAMTLARHNDRSGEDILLAVVDGDRPSSAGLVSGTMHTVHDDLHSPATLAKMGAIQGFSMLPGPFGIGVSAYEFMHKSGGSSARAAAIEELAQVKTPVIRKALLGALDDKDAAVRAAAAIAVGGYRESAVTTAVANLFYDPKLPVRLSAAAGFLLATGSAPGQVPETHKSPRRAHHS